MAKDLTTSKLDRQNVLNNDIAFPEIQKAVNIKCIIWNDNLYLTKDMVATFFGVEVRTIERYINKYSEELQGNGYAVLKGKKLEEFLKIRALKDAAIRPGDAQKSMENIVAQELRASGHKLFFYSRSDTNNRENNIEIDFLIRKKRKICPIEVKSGVYRKHSSLDKFRSKFKGKIGQPYILYTKDVLVKEEVIHLPIYMAMFL